MNNGFGNAFCGHAMHNSTNNARRGTRASCFSSAEIHACRISFAAASSPARVLNNGAKSTTPSSSIGNKQSWPQRCTGIGGFHSRTNNKEIDYATSPVEAAASALTNPWSTSTAERRMSLHNKPPFFR